MLPYNNRRALPVFDLIQGTRQLVEQPDAVIMLEETLPAIPSSTLSDFAIWKVNDCDDLKYEAEFKPSLYLAASRALGVPVPTNRRKWVLFALGILFALAALPLFASPTGHTVDIPKSWTNAHPTIHRGLPNSSKTRRHDNARPAISDRSTNNSGSMMETFNYTAKYGLAYVLLPSKLMSEVKRTVSHWIGWLREVFEESIYVDLE